MSFQENKVVLLAADLAGFTRAAAPLDAATLATFVDAWYRGCAATIKKHGGRVVKFMGDACFATFPEQRVLDAVDAASELGTELERLRPSHPLKVDLGVNVHLAVVAEGEFGPDGDARYDVIGNGVNHLFLMGGGAGIRISEPVYRALPNERRGPWRKHQPAATYTLSER